MKTLDYSTHLFIVAALTWLAPTHQSQAATLGEALDAPQLTWTTGGAANWSGQSAVTHDGVDAAACGGLTNMYSQSWLETTVTGRVAVAFWWKSASPGGFAASFFLNTNSAYVDGLYADADWRQKVVSFAGGTNTLRWTSYLGSTNPPAAIFTNWLDHVVVTNITALEPTVLTGPEPALAIPENYGVQSNLRVSVIGDIPMTFQWQRSGTNLAEAHPFSGVTTPVLGLNARTAADGGAYRLIASNAWGVVTSAVCSVSVVPAKPALYPFQPWDVVLAPGASFEYFVTIMGTAPFGIQWFKDGNPIPSSRIESATFTDAGGYSLVVTNAYGAATSRVAQVTISTNLPMIVSGPSPEYEEVQPGDYVSFSVQAAGPEPLAYSWRKVGDELEVGAWDWFSFDSADPTNTGLYRVIVTNNNGAVTSRVCVLAVSPATALGVAVDAPQLVVTNHNADWPQWTPDVSGTNAHDDRCAARSPEIPFWGSSAFSTAVTGPTNVSFWWRISAGAQTYLDVAVDGSVSNTISGETLWQQQTLVLPAGEHTLTWMYRKEDPGIAGQNAAWVDQFTLGGTIINPGGNTNEITAFTTSGSTPHWYLQTTNTHDGVNAWQSGAIADNETNGLTATVAGPGTLTFWWQVDSEQESDFLEFWLDGAPQVSISGQTNWHQRTFVLGAGSHTLEWLYDKDGSVDAGADAGWVDEVIFTPTSAPLTLGQALNATNLTFTTGGDAPWFVQVTDTHDGVAAPQSGPIGNNQKSWLRTTVTGPGLMSFWLASETANGDTFWIRAAGSGSGYSAWSRDNWQYQEIEIPAGDYEVEWSYEKDGSGSAGADAAWVDQVTWTPGNAGQPPVFVLDPTNTVVSVDTELRFAVEASGELPITYTLLREGSPVLVQTVSTAGPVLLSKIVSSTSESGNYWAAATNVVGGTTSRVAQVTVIDPAHIYSFPSNRVVLKNRAFSLTVSASGEPPLKYQWFKNGAPLAGATTSTLAVASAGYTNAGNYFVTVTNATGVATSSVARVVVTPCFYSVQNLGVLKSGTVSSSWPSEAVDINNVGEVVGWSVTDEIRLGSEVKHGFVWVADHMVDLGDGRDVDNVSATNRLLGSSAAYSISDNFDIAGTYEYRVNPSLDGYGHATLWRQVNCGTPGGIPGHCPLEMVDVHPRDIFPPDTVGVSINNRRQILLQGGQSWVLQHYGYLLTLSDSGNRFSAYETQDLGVSGGYIVPNKLNDGGLVVGRYLEYIGGDMPYLYDGTPHVGTDATTNLYWGEFRSVNDAGVIAGIQRQTVQGWNVRRPFLLHPDGRFFWLTNSAQDPWSFDVRDINNRNQLVGQNFASLGTLYRDEQWFTLNDLLVANQRLVNVTVANAINDRGQIVGVAWFPVDWYPYWGYNACLLTPTAGGANQSPVAVNDEYRLAKAVPIRIPTSLLLANDSDADGDGLSVVALGEGTTTPTQAGGTASLRAGALFYTPPSKPFTTDQFNYVVSDGLGGQTNAHLTITLDQHSPQPDPLIRLPKRLDNGDILLSGSGPQGALVIIYSAGDPRASHWRRDCVVVVPASGQWSIVRPGTVGGHAVFYRAEFFDDSR